MSEVLSQSEIDALLSAISTGEMNADDLKKEEDPAKKIKIYDFKRALRFSKDQIRGLTRIHENFARLLTTFYSAQLRTFIQIGVASADQLPYEEFIRSIPKMTMLNVFEVPPLEGRALMEINPNIAYAMLDRVLGGKGVSINKIENLTEIESRIMSNLFEKTLDNLREAWEAIIAINPILTDFEVNPQFLQMVAPNDTVVVISLNTQIGEVSGMINICIPHVVLEPIMSKLSSSYWMQAQKRRKPEEVDALKMSIKRTEFKVVAELGKSVLNVQEFLQLDVGDIVQVDRMLGDPLIVTVGSQPKFTAQAGKVGKKLAIQILDIIQGEGDDNIDE